MTSSVERWRAGGAPPIPGLTEAPRAPSQRRFGAFSTIHSIGGHGCDEGADRWRTSGNYNAFPAIAKRLDAINMNHAALHRGGAKVVCGTDAGIGSHKPHDVLRYGVSNFFPAIGMTNAEALRANTSVAAKACGIGNRKGTTSIGKDADLLAVASDPLDDIGCIEHVPVVFVKGNPIRLTRPDAPSHA